MRNYMVSYRAKQKQLTQKDSKVYGKVNSKVNVNPLEGDIEEELDIDKDNIVLPKGNMSVDTDLSRELHSVDFDNLLDYWNKKSKLKNIRAITKTRKGHLNARLKEHGRQALYKVIENCSNSSFMRGNNKKGWMATFDWVFLPNNFVKVLEGNYLDRDANTKNNDDLERRVNAVKEMMSYDS
jgi:hypothetical protein